MGIFNIPFRVLCLLSSKPLGMSGGGGWVTSTEGWAALMRIKCGWAEKCADVPLANGNEI